MFLYGFLGYVPVIASFAMGMAYLLDDAPRLAFKIAGSIAFLAAAWLQFLSPYALAGLLVQIALALALEFRRRWYAPTRAS